MQLIVVGAAIVSLVIQQWGTAIALIIITLFNALVGLRQAGKAQSAMNALQSMMKATARVRRDGAESEIDAEQLCVRCNSDREHEGQQVAAAPAPPRVQDQREHFQQAGNLPCCVFIGAGDSDGVGMRS